VARCLTALSRQDHTNLEVIVVDNASPDATAQIVARDFPRVKLVRTDRNLGVAGGNNAGIKAASGDVLILTNVDTEASPDWVSLLMRSLENDPTIGIASSKLVYPDGRIQYGGGIIDPRQGFARHASVGKENHFESAISDIDFATGASLAIRRTTLEEVGLEDEAYFPIDYEDSDLSYRVRLAGRRVVYVPEAVSTHYESSTVRPLAPHRVLSSQAGRLRFVAKFWRESELTGAFLREEVRWLEQLRESRDDTGKFVATAMPIVYFKTLLDLDDLVGWRVRLGVGDAESSRQALLSVLTHLRAACAATASSAMGDAPQTRAMDAVRETLAAWLPEEHLGAGAPLLLSMQTAQARVNPHLPIAWPNWPPGVVPKVRAAFQKVTRRLLSWYINPLVEQQNEINANLLRSTQMLSQEVLLLRSEIAARDKAAVTDTAGGPVPHPLSAQD
jgi:GT2 family glycosyltransferase